MDTRQQPDSGYFTMHEECGKRGEIATDFRSLLTREPLVFGTAVGISYFFFFLRKALNLHSSAPDTFRSLFLFPRPSLFDFQPPGPSEEIFLCHNAHQRSKLAMVKIIVPSTEGLR